MGSNPIQSFSQGVFEPLITNLMTAATQPPFRATRGLTGWTVDISNTGNKKDLIQKIRNKFIIDNVQLEIQFHGIVRREAAQVSTGSSLWTQLRKDT